MTLGIVVPTFQEFESISALLQDIKKHAPNARVIVVDDSPDERTAEAVKPYLADSVQLIRRKAKGGRGTAIIEGMRALIAQEIEPIIEMDADFSHPPSQIAELANKLSSENLDLLIASRYLPQSVIKNWPVSRRIFSLASNKLARAVLGVPVRDYTNGFRCYSRRAAEIVVESCGRRGAGFIVLSEILVNLHYRGFHVAEVPTMFVNRVRGESSVNANEVMGALRGLARIYQLKRDLTKGMR